MTSLRNNKDKKNHELETVNIARDVSITYMKLLINKNQLGSTISFSLFEKYISVIEKLTIKDLTVYKKNNKIEEWDE